MAGPTHRRAARVGVAKRERAGGFPRWLAAVVLIVAVAGGLTFLGTWPPLATVMSASMAPTINTGDVVVLQRLHAPAKVGDVVMVHVPDEARSRFGYPPVVIHRVAKIAADGTITTKGDAKKEVDPFTVPRAAITTRVLTHVPAAGRVFSFLGSTLGLIWMAGGAVMLLVMPLLERYRETQRSMGAERELVLDELRVQVELLPRQIERAVANAVAAIEPPATPAVHAPAPADAAPAHALFATPTDTDATPSPRIVAAAKLAAVAATRLAAPPAPSAPDVPAPRLPLAGFAFTPAVPVRYDAAPAPAVPERPSSPRRFSAAAFVPMVDVKPLAVPAPPTPDRPTPRLGAVSAFEPSIDGLSFFAMPAPAAPAAPAPRLTAASTFTPPFLARTPLAPPPAPAARLAAASTFTPVLATVPAPPAPPTPAPRLLAASAFTPVLTTVPAVAPAPPTPAARFSRLVPATQRT